MSSDFRIFAGSPWILTIYSYKLSIHESDEEKPMVYLNERNSIGENTEYKAYWYPVPKYESLEDIKPNDQFGTTSDGGIVVNVGILGNKIVMYANTFGDEAVYQLHNSTHTKAWNNMHHKWMDLPTGLGIGREPCYGYNVAVKLLEMIMPPYEMKP